jgi:hypothetical protein
MGICALDPEAWDKLAEECRKNGIEHGVAADLKSLITRSSEDQRPVPIAEITMKSMMWGREC